MDPDVGEHVRVGQAEPVAELHAQAAEDVGGDLRRVGDDEDQVALARRGLLDDRALRLVGQELGDRALDLAAGLEREVREALRPEASGALGQLVDLAAGDAGHPGRHDRLDPAAGREGVVEDPNPDDGVPSGPTSTDPRSTSSIPNRTSGLSEPNRSMASS